MIKDNVKYLTVDEIVAVHSSIEEEREITLVKTDADKVWNVYVSDNKMLTKLKRVMKAAPEGSIKCRLAGKDANGFPTGYFFELPVDCVHFRAGKKKRKKPLTEEQRKAIGQRFRAGKAKKLANSNEKEDIH